MKKEYTITGNYTLPSLGKIYEEEVSPDVTIRSMTTAEEMKRLSPSERPYQTIASIIDDCIVDDMSISSYDMCLGDYQFLLHKVRAVTYGSNYAMTSRCPYCRFENTDSINLDEMSVSSYSEDIEKYLEFDLPQTKKHIRLKMQTPRMVDDVSARAKEMKKKSPNMNGDPAFLLNIASYIDTVDGKKLDAISAPEFVRNLPMMDVNMISQYSDKLNSAIGLNTDLVIKCDGCGLEYDSSFRITSEFFRPSVNI